MTKSRDGTECSVKKGLFEAATIIIANNTLLQQKRLELWKRLNLILENEEGEDDLKKQDLIVGRLGKKVRWLGWETNLLFRTTAC
jgi:hypothetical protein